MLTETRTRTDWWPLTAICLAVFMLMLDATVTTVALPPIGDDLGADLGVLQWVVTSYVLTMALLQIPAGRLADRLGHRRAFLGGIALFAAASLACGLARSAAFLIAARAVQGFAGAVLFATTLALVAACYRGRARGTAFGIRGAVSGLAVVAGPVLGGVLVAGLSWRWAFWLNLPVAVVCAVLATRIPDVPPSRGGRVPLTLRLSTGLIGAFTVQAGAFALFAYVSVYFQDDLGWSPLKAGLAFLPAVVPIMLAGPVAGSLMDRAPVRLFVPTGLLVIAAGLVLSWGAGPRPAYSVLACGLIVAGLGAGAALPALAALGTKAPPESLGAAAGVYNTVQQLGGALGIGLYGLIVPGPGLPVAFAIAAGVTAAGAAATAVLARGSVR
ncbi:MFS transporter [Actinorhabdospora filicis]|uniref:MFS transporter n=1 Tax=Actinorhabdospora filicis TaxID=1785913 RepID=A0A9W6WB51_9ACTN|nr:MFS transporter [Actinorhabdospora filicis]GLZ80284.1 MFS transporter [Actinorhabdospora filicis]